MTGWVSGAMTVTVVVGDISSLARRTDTIVSPDDNYLSHSGGASQAIWRAAGQALLKVEQLSRHPSVGDVWVSPAGQLKAARVLHAITLNLDTGHGAGLKECQELYDKVLEEVVSLQFRSVSLPLLSSGAAGLGVSASAQCLSVALAKRAWEEEELAVGIVVVDTSTEEVVKGSLLRTPPPAARVRRLQELASKVNRALEEPLAALKAAPHDMHAAIELFGLTAKEFRRQQAFRSDDDLLSAFVAGQEAQQQAVRPHLDRLVRIDARSRLIDATETLLKAISQPATVGAQEAPVGMALPSRTSTSGDEFAGAGRPLDRLLEPAFDHEGTVAGHRALEAPPPVISAPHPEPVRRLAMFLMRKLSRGARRSLLEGLRAKGYRGDDDRCILEYCLQEDPLEILQSQFTEHGLRQYLSGSMAADKIPSGMVHVAEAVLSTLGFCPPPEVPSWTKVAQEAASDYSSRHYAHEDEIMGRVLRASGEVERLLKPLLYFLASTVIGAPLRDIAIAQKIESHNLDKATLGTLMRLYGYVSAQVPGTELAVAVHDSTGRELRLPAGMPTAAAIRNSFAHGKSMGSKGVRDSAGEFFQQVEVFAHELGDSSEFVRPQWVRVDQVVRDTWDRRIVDITDEHGRKHRMYTEEPVKVARIYLILQRSNPFYVEPVLGLVDL